MYPCLFLHCAAESKLEGKSKTSQCIKPPRSQGRDSNSSARGFRFVFRFRISSMGSHGWLTGWLAGLSGLASVSTRPVLSQLQIANRNALSTPPGGSCFIALKPIETFGARQPNLFFLLPPTFVASADWGPGQLDNWTIGPWAGLDCMAHASR